MNYKIIHRIFAALSFLLAMTVYSLTVQPTVPFWDCGEFSSASVWQQVPHPPGAPLFLMLGKLFHTIIPFGDPGWRINLLASASAAVTVFLLYLIAVKVIKNFIKDNEIKDLGQAIAVFGSSFLAAAALTFSDTFWFNAVESEVYATSTLFAVLIVYLMMKWNEKWNEPGNERYLLLIAYLIGLSTGVHLLSVLTIFSIVLVVYFRKFDLNLKSFLIMGAIAIGIFFIIYPFIVKYIPAMLAGHSPNRNLAHEYSIEDSTFLVFLALAIIALALFGAWYSWKHKMPIINFICSAFILVLLGYTTYTQILLRSNANPPMNENEPKNFSKLASYLGREQYGNAPSYPRRYKTEPYHTDRYNKRDENGEYVYGKWISPKTKAVTRKDGQRITVEDWDNTDINTMGELTFMWKYQIHHMYFRYFGWNFIGRTSDIQDKSLIAWPTTTKEDVAPLNYGSGYADKFPIKFWAIPFILGLIGLLYHFNKDWKMALVFTALFLVTGVLSALQQNQQEPQPRERDYFYAVSFVVWALWIGLGSYGIIESINRIKIKVMPAVASLLILFILVPANMAYGGWFIHSRAGNYIPFDYSYNILQSTEKNAIVFTNGDNDTFPVWYLQDVMGVRRDVRIVNLSLGNTLWYIHQLKHRKPWGAEKIPLTFSDESLLVDEMSELALSYDFGEARRISIPVSKDYMAKFTDDKSLIADPKFEFVFKGKPYRQVQGKQMYIFRVQDKLVLDILQNINFEERPVYFSNTVGPDAFAGLQDYFRLEGMAMRICPVPQSKSQTEAIDKEVMEKCLMEYDNSENFSKTPKYGFKFRNLNNMNVYYDEVHRRLMGTYRSLFISYASNVLTEDGNNEKAAEILDEMNKLISVEQFPLSFDQLFRVAKLYEDIGAKEQMERFANLCIKESEFLINNQNIQPEFIYREMMGRFVGPYRYATFSYELLGQYDNAVMTLERLKSLSQAYLDQLGGGSMNETTQRIQYSILDIESQIVEMTIAKINKNEGSEAALKYAYEKLEEFNKDPQMRYFVNYIQEKISEISVESDTVISLNE